MTACSKRAILLQIALFVVFAVPDRIDAGDARARAGVAAIADVGGFASPIEAEGSESFDDPAGPSSPRPADLGRFPSTGSLLTDPPGARSRAYWRPLTRAPPL